MTDSERRSPEYIARWAVTQTVALQEHTRLWVRSGTFCGPPEWRVLPAMEKPKVGLGWKEAAIITVEFAASADDWFALFRLADRVSEALAGI